MNEQVIVHSFNITCLSRVLDMITIYFAEMSAEFPSRKRKNQSEKATRKKMKIQDVTVQKPKSVLSKVFAVATTTPKQEFSVNQIKVKNVTTIKNGVEKSPQKVTPPAPPVSPPRVFKTISKKEVKKVEESPAINKQALRIQ